MKQFLTVIAITLAVALTACKRDEMFENILPDNTIGFGTAIIPETIFTKTNTQTTDTLFADGTQCTALGELFLVRTDAPITTTPITRAGGSYVTDDILPNGQRFGVYAYLHSDEWASVSATATPNFMCNQDVLVSDTDSEGQTFTYDPTKYWPISNKLSFIAYYPYNGAGIVMKDKNDNNYIESSTGTPKAQFTVPSNIAEQIDLMYTIPLTGKTADDGLLTFNFQHALTRVTFSVKLKSGNVPIQVKSITISGVKNTGTLDITNGTWENTGNATSGAGEYTFNPDSIISSTTATDFRVFSTETQLLLPQTFTDNSTAKISITYNYGSAEETMNFFLANTTATEWISNTSINYTISLSKKEEEDVEADIIYRDSTYEIYTAKGLKAFADLVNGAENTSHAVCLGYGHFDFGSTHPAIDGKLMNDIYLNTICGDGAGGTPAANWTPIGAFSNINTDENFNYRGIFEGNNKIVSDLYINSTSDGQGLFKRLIGGTIRNLKVTGTVKGRHNSAGIVSSVIGGGTLSNCTFSGDVTTTGTRTGGVVGYLNNSTMENCINEGGNITTSDSQTGGVAGCVDNNSTVKACTNNATIRTENDTATVTDIIVGGVVGMITNSTMETCANMGAVSGNKDMVGGVLGFVKNSKAVACYSTGSVNGKDQIGGVVGVNNNNGTITACYSTGAVGGGNHVGGVVGDNNLGSTITACYSTGSVTGSATGNNAAIGGIVGYNGSSSGGYAKSIVKYCASASNVGTKGIGNNLGTVTNCVQNSTNIRGHLNNKNNNTGVTVGTTTYSLRPGETPSIWGGNITGGSADTKKAPKLFWE